MKIYTKYNFHKYTFCIFNEVCTSEIDLLKPNYTSKSGSSYFFTEQGVYRKSDHWGRAANCKWRLQSKCIENNGRTKIGFAQWTEFHAINETDKLYFIQVNYAEKCVQYVHKNSTAQSNLYLRNAAETAKRVKEIRHLIENKRKLTYWNYEDTWEILLTKVIEMMVETDLTILQIKQKLEAI